MIVLIPEQLTSTVATSVCSPGYYGRSRIAREGEAGLVCERVR